MMDDDQMAPRALVLTRGAVILGLQLTSGANFDQDKLNKIEDPLLASIGRTLITTLEKHLPNDTGAVSPSALKDWVRDKVPDAPVTNFDAGNLGMKAGPYRPTSTQGKCVRNIIIDTRTWLNNLT